MYYVILIDVYKTTQYFGDGVSCAEEVRVISVTRMVSGLWSISLNTGTPFVCSGEWCAFTGGPEMLGQYTVLCSTENCYELKIMVATGVVVLLKC